MGSMQQAYNVKRKMEDSSDQPNSKDARSSDEGMGIATHKEGESMATFYKRMSDNVQIKTFVFNRSAFTTITTDLMMFPMQHSITALFTEDMRACMRAAMGANNFKAVIVQPVKARLQNPIVLSDEIKITSAGSTEVSSFVQNAKILHYRIGGESFDAHAYQFLKANKALKVDAKHFCNSKRPKTGECPWTATFDTADLNDIQIGALKTQNTLTAEVIQVTNGEGKDNSVPTQFGYLRDKAVTVTNPTVELLPMEQMTTNMLRDLPHEYLDRDGHLDLALGSEQIFTDPTCAGNLFSDVDSVILRNSTKVPVFYSHPGYLNRVMCPADGTRYITNHRAHNSRENWQLHDYVTMVPIVNSSGAVMKIRAHAEIVVEVKVHLLWTANNFSVGNAEQFNLMLDAPDGLPLRETFSNENTFFVNFWKH